MLINIILASLIVGIAIHIIKRLIDGTNKEALIEPEKKVKGYNKGDYLDDNNYIF